MREGKSLLFILKRTNNDDDDEADDEADDDDDDEGDEFFHEREGESKWLKWADMAYNVGTSLKTNCVFCSNK